MPPSEVLLAEWERKDAEYERTFDELDSLRAMLVSKLRKLFGKQPNVPDISEYIGHIISGLSLGILPVDGGINYSNAVDILTEENFKALYDRESSEDDEICPEELLIHKDQIDLIGGKTPFIYV